MNMRHFIFGGMAHNAQGKVGDKKGGAAQLGRKRSKVGCILGGLGLNFLPATHYFSLFSAQVALGAGLTFRQTPVPALWQPCFLSFVCPKKKKQDKRAACAGPFAIQPRTARLRRDIPTKKPWNGWFVP